MEATFDVVWPRSPRGVQAQQCAPRLEAGSTGQPLDGRRVAFLWDHLFRGDELFPLLERELKNRFPDLEVVGYDVFGNTHGADELQMISTLPEALKRERVDAVVSGMGC